MVKENICNNKINKVSSGYVSLKNCFLGNPQLVFFVSWHRGQSILEASVSVERVGDKQTIGLEQEPSWWGIPSCKSKREKTTDTNGGRVLPNKSCNRSRPRFKNPAEEVTADRLS
jgi:hypothetical protein